MDFTMSCQNCKHFREDAEKMGFCYLNPPVPMPAVKGTTEHSYDFDADKWKNPLVYAQSFCSHFSLMEWHLFFESLNLTGQARELARNLTVQGYKGGQLALVLPKNIRHLMTKPIVAKLEKVLRERLSEHLDVNIMVL